MKSKSLSDADLGEMLKTMFMKTLESFRPKTFGLHQFQNTS